MARDLAHKGSIAETLRFEGQGRQNLLLRDYHVVILVAVIFEVRRFAEELSCQSMDKPT